MLSFNFLLLLLGYFQITWAFNAIPKQQYKEDLWKKHNHKVYSILSWETLMGEKNQQNLLNNIFLIQCQD